EAVGEFRVKSSAVLGSASLKFVARRGQADAQMEETVSIRPAAPYRTQLTLGRFEDKSATISVARDLFTEHRQVEASVSTLALIWGEGLTAYLDHYEYSCSEQ